MSQKVYQVFTDSFIKAMEQGDLPAWTKPWGSIVCLKSIKGHDYRGINVLMLLAHGKPGPFITAKQAKQQGGHVNKGETGIPILFWNWIKKKGKDGDKDATIPLVRYYTVFCVKTQCTGIKLPKWAKTEKTAPVDAEIVDVVQDVIKGFKLGPKVEHGYTHACYMPARDRVELPKPEDFVRTAEYACAAFHELVHSTGHWDRLGRFEKDDGPAHFNQASYSKEELVAEMGAAFLLGAKGIDCERTIENAKAYLNGWLSKLRKDPKLVVFAAARAQKAVDHILGKEPYKGKEEDK